MKRQRRGARKPSRSTSTISENDRNNGTCDSAYLSMTTECRGFDKEEDRVVVVVKEVEKKEEEWKGDEEKSHGSNGHEEEEDE